MLTTPYPVIDACCVVGPFMARTPGQSYTIDAMLQEHERFGIQRRLCLHAESRDGVAEEGNAAVATMAERHSGITPIWTVLPPRRFRAEPVDEMLARAQAARVGMVALFPKTQGHHMATWANDALYAALAEARLPLLLDTGQQSHEQVYELAQRYPRLPIVLSQASYREERLLVPILDFCPNVHIALAERFIPTDGIEAFTKRYGPKRLIFSSGWPMQSPGPLIGYVMYAEVSQSAKEAVLAGNVQRLLAGVQWPVHQAKEVGA